MSAEVPPPPARFVNNTKYRSRIGSIHSDVPVKPTCPNAAADMRVPHDEVGSIVSQPSARELPGTVLFVANTPSTAGSKTLAPLSTARASRVVQTDGQVEREVRADHQPVSGGKNHTLRYLVIWSLI